jgi:hypothetical protein
MMRLTDITVQLHQETQRAILVSDDGDLEKAVWLPKSQVEFAMKAGSDVAEVTLPEWLAIERRLV